MIIFHRKKLKKMAAQGEKSKPDGNTSEGHDDVKLVQAITKEKHELPKGDVDRPNDSPHKDESDKKSDGNKSIHSQEFY